MLETVSNNDCHAIPHQIKLDKLDNELCNLPKDVYINKLLDLCENDESTVYWYRDTLCSRAKRLSDCPSGKLLNRKTTKRGSSTARYAKDCYILYMFMQGEKSSINEIFDKNKDPFCGTDIYKLNAVEVKVTVQSLLQRITNLENVVHSRESVIESLTSDLELLQSENKLLRSEHDRLKAESMSKFSKYDAFQKLTSENFKRADTDRIDYELQKVKTNDE